jgi:hypothetical protein
LAGGYLWIVFLWLVLDPLIDKSHLDSEPYRSAHHLGNDIGPVALGLTVTFFAYLIGTFFNELRSLVARLYLRARQTAGSSLAVQKRTEAIEEKRRQAAESRRRASDRWRQIGKVDVRRRQIPLHGGVWRRIQVTVEFLVEFIFALLTLPQFLFGLGVTVVGKVMDFVDAFVFRLAGWLIGSRAEPYRPFLSTQGVNAVERYLKERRKDFPKSVNPGVADVLADFPVIRTRLIYQSPDTVSEYDRLRAEADFRTAIVPPLVMIMAVFVVKLSWMWALTAPLILVLVVTAKTKRREAGDILADSLGVVDAPSVRPSARSTPQEADDPAA